MYMLVLSLSMLFAGAMAAYLLIRSTHQPWPPPGFPSLPRTLWLSTLAIVLSSLTIHRAVKAVDRDDPPALNRALVFTLGLGVTFLALQMLAWWQIVRQLDPAAGVSQYLKLFYVLSGLHAVHVLGGLGPLAVVTGRALAGRYGCGRSGGVHYSAIYWHFLGAVWCMVFLVVSL
jgi:cytochrome c oxidase subunit 3